MRKVEIIDVEIIEKWYDHEKYIVHARFDNMPMIIIINVTSIRSEVILNALICNEINIKSFEALHSCTIPLLAIARDIDTGIEINLPRITSFYWFKPTPAFASFLADVLDSIIVEAKKDPIPYSDIANSILKRVADILAEIVDGLRSVARSP